MGSNIHDFIVRLEFAPDGTVEHVYYRDQEGCGHEHAVPLSSYVDDMIEYHLKHYRESHYMAPPRKCGLSVEVVVPGVPEPKYVTCSLEPHSNDTKHKFEV